MKTANLYKTFHKDQNNELYTHRQISSYIEIIRSDKISLWMDLILPIFLGCIWTGYIFSRNRLFTKILPFNFWNWIISCNKTTRANTRTTSWVQIMRNIVIKTETSHLYVSIICKHRLKVCAAARCCPCFSQSTKCLKNTWNIYIISAGDRFHLSLKERYRMGRQCCPCGNPPGGNPP